MSWLSKYVFDPVVAAFTRSQSSAVPPSTVLSQAGQTAAAQVGAAVQQLGVQAISGTLTANSALGTGNALVGTLEDTLRDAVDTVVTDMVGEVPVAGVFLSPIAVNASNTALSFIESHAHDYIASLFAHAKTQVAAAQAPAVQAAPSTTGAVQSMKTSSNNGG